MTKKLLTHYKRHTFFFLIKMLLVPLHQYEKHSLSGLLKDGRESERKRTSMGGRKLHFINLKYLRFNEMVVLSS